MAFTLQTRTNWQLAIYTTSESTSEGPRFQRSSQFDFEADDEGAAGAKPADVVRLGIYVKDYRREQATVIGSALRGMFAAGRMPASTWLGVSTLALDELIEIEAVAVTVGEHPRATDQ
jgi:endoribonuclease L-PSP